MYRYAALLPASSRASRRYRPAPAHCRSPWGSAGCRRRAAAAAPAGQSTSSWHLQKVSDRNLSYKEFIARSEPDQVAKLKTAERLWIKCRDANCQFYAAPVERARSQRIASCTSRPPAPCDGPPLQPCVQQQKQDQTGTHDG